MSGLGVPSVLLQGRALYVPVRCSRELLGFCADPGSRDQDPCDDRPMCQEWTVLAPNGDSLFLSSCLQCTALIPQGVMVWGSSLSSVYFILENSCSWPQFPWMCFGVVGFPVISPQPRVRV